MLDLLLAMKICKWQPTVVLSGSARGADHIGELWAEAHNVYTEKYPAKWDLYGKSAGYKRNTIMASNAEALIALWDGHSPGTKHMIDIAHRHDLLVYIQSITNKPVTVLI